MRSPFARRRSIGMSCVEYFLWRELHPCSAPSVQASQASALQSSCPKAFVMIDGRASRRGRANARLFASAVWTFLPSGVVPLHNCSSAIAARLRRRALRRSRMPSAKSESNLSSTSRTSVRMVRLAEALEVTSRSRSSASHRFSAVGPASHARSSAVRDMCNVYFAIFP